MYVYKPKPVIPQTSTDSRDASRQAASKLDVTRHTTIIKYGTDQEVETGRKARSTQALSGYPNQGISAGPKGHGLQTRITRSTK